MILKEAKTEMTFSSLVELMKLLERDSIPAWLDGGWEGDALLQTQTRTHQAIDIVVSVSDVPKLQELLAIMGFSVQEGNPPNSFVLANGVGLEVDVHAVNFDDDGNGVYRMQNGEDWIYQRRDSVDRGLSEE